MHGHLPMHRGTTQGASPRNARRLHRSCLHTSSSPATPSAGHAVAVGLLYVRGRGGKVVTFGAPARAAGAGGGGAAQRPARGPEGRHIPLPMSRPFVRKPYVHPARGSCSTTTSREVRAPAGVGNAGILWRQAHPIRRGRRRIPPDGTRRRRRTGRPRRHDGRGGYARRTAREVVAAEGARQPAAALREAVAAAGKGSALAPAPRRRNVVPIRGPRALRDEPRRAPTPDTEWAAEDAVGAHVPAARGQWRLRNCPFGGVEGELFVRRRRRRGRERGGFAAASEWEAVRVAARAECPVGASKGEFPPSRAPGRRGRRRVTRGPVSEDCGSSGLTRRAQKLESTGRAGTEGRPRWRLGPCRLRWGFTSGGPWAWTWRRATTPPQGSVASWVNGPETSVVTIFRATQRAALCSHVDM